MNELYSICWNITNKCNENCKFCYRKVCKDNTLEQNKRIFDNLSQVKIDKLTFSGGEPTLNPNIIIYTINKIIEQNLNVGEIVMVTNGQIFNRELLEAFNRFNEYKNKNSLESAFHEYARITFSNDKYHYPIKQGVKDNYYSYSRGIRITENDIEEKDIYKTVFSTIGKDFDYKLDQLRYCKEVDFYFVINNIYITAKGYMTSEGMGQYTDMDRINMGHISDTTLQEALSKYGKPVFNAPKIVYPTKEAKGKLI